MSKFSRMRDGVTVFGKTMTLFCKCQRSTTCAGVLPCDSAAATISSFSRRSVLFCASGPQDSTLVPCTRPAYTAPRLNPGARSEEHTSELQSRGHLVGRLLL